MKTTLPTDSSERKEYAIGRGCLAYFPAAIAGVARHSFKAGAKHTGGELVHKRFLSGDHEDCIERHLMDLRDLQAQLARGGMGAAEGFVEKAILDEANALAWRALALSQELHEKYGGAPLAPAARLLSQELAMVSVSAFEAQKAREKKEAGLGHSVAELNKADLERAATSYSPKRPLGADGPWHEDAVPDVGIG